MVSSGSVGRTVIDPQKILKRGIEKQSMHVVLVHNHPSGSPLPSEEDIRQTDLLRRALSVVEIRLIDHVIVSEDAYFSFADDQLTRTR